jgi:hypothetical protein
MSFEGDVHRYLPHLVFFLTDHVRDDDDTERQRATIKTPAFTTRESRRFFVLHLLLKERPL